MNCNILVFQDKYYFPNETNRLPILLVVMWRFKMNPTFTPIHTPKIYAYSDSRFPNQLKIGYTAQETVGERMKQHYPTLTPSQSWQVEFETSAIKNDGSYFKDFAVHKMLEQMSIKRIAGEWFECDLDTVKNAILNIKQAKTFERQKNKRFCHASRAIRRC